jgi:hypothetical protein
MRRSSGKPDTARLNLDFLLAAIVVGLLDLQHLPVARELDLPQDRAGQHLYFAQAVVVIVRLD